MITIASTACAYSLAAYLEAADLIAVTCATAFRTAAAPKDSVRRSISGALAYSTYVPQLASEAVTAVSELAPIVLGPDDPEHELIAQLAGFRSLEDGWDGEAAMAPNRAAIRDAVRFIQAAGPLSERLEPTLHTDGAVLLELEDGLGGSLKFRGDDHIVYAVKGVRPGIVPFDGSNVPDVLRTALEPPQAVVKRAA